MATFIVTIFLVALGAFGSILGRSSASVLRGLVSDCVSKQPSAAFPHFFSVERIIAACTSGYPDELLSVFAEVAGIFVNSEIWSLSANRNQPTKYDGSLCLFLPALVAFMLYFGSFCLRINTSTAAQPLRGGNDLMVPSGLISRQKAV